MHRPEEEPSVPVSPLTLPSLCRLLPNLVDNLVNRVLANVLPDLVRMGKGVVSPGSHRRPSGLERNRAAMFMLVGTTEWQDGRAQAEHPQLRTPSWGAFFFE